MNAFDYPAVPSKPGCKLESTEMLLKNTLLILRPHFWKLFSTKSGYNFGSVILISSAGDSDVGGQLICVWESLFQDISLCSSAISYSF